MRCNSSPNDVKQNVVMRRHKKNKNLWDLLSFHTGYIYNKSRAFNMLPLLHMLGA